MAFNVNKNKTRAFTLTELIVVLAIGMTLLAAVTTSFMSQTRVYYSQEQINEMHQNARGALDVITRELKMAGYKPNGGSVTGVTYSTGQLQIDADLNADGIISTSASDHERIIYAFDSAAEQITRKVGSSANTAQVLADNITAFSFDYFDSSGAATTISDNIRQVRITITARTAERDPNHTSNNGYRTYTVSATITPPNLAL